MKSDIKVSVIIPIYNAEKYLKECLDSVLNQTLKEIEIICVDDGSTDESLNILKEYSKRDNRLKIYKQNNLFAGVARNTGLEKSQGKYVYFMDSDDIADKYLLEKTVRKSDETDADICVFNYIRFDTTNKIKEYRDGLIKKILPQKESFNYKDIPFNICNIINPTPWNKLFRRDFIIKEKLKYLNISTTNDITFATMSAIVAKRIVYLEETLYAYRINHSKTITSIKQNKLDNIILAVLEVDKQAQKLDSYNLIKNSIRVFIIKNLFVGLERYAGSCESCQYIHYKEKMESIFYSYPLFIDIKENDINNMELYQKILKFKQCAAERNDLSFLPSIIISLTSYQKRINSVHKAIATLISQTKKADKIILWLSEMNFPNKEKDLPIELLDYAKKDIEIKWVKEDLKSHKKYYYAFKYYSNSIIITVDDDLIFDKFMIEKLIESYMKYPYAVSAMRVHYIEENSNGRIAPYKNWLKEYNGIINIPSMRLLATTGAGTLFPPNCLNTEVFNIEAIKMLCPTTDDLWIKANQVLSNIPVVLVDKNQKLKYITGTQDEALEIENVYGLENDKQLQKIILFFKNSINIEEIILKKSDFNTEIINLEYKNNYLYNQILALKNSNEYKIGSKILFFPTMLMKIIRYYKLHGFNYTIYRIMEELKKR